MIKTAAVCSDIVKIQTIYASNLTYREDYEEYRLYEPEHERLKGLELSRKDEELFIFKCMEYGVESMTTIFVPQHAPRFNELGYDNLKISGYSIPAFDYGKKLKTFKFKRLFFSTSSLSLEEIKLTIKNLNEMGIEYYMMQCTCIYPTPLDKLNLQNIDY